MPIIKSAKKKLRQDVKRKLKNKRYELAYKKIIDRIKKHKKADKAYKASNLLKEAYRAIDKAEKIHVIHKNKANRLKAMVSRRINK